MIPPSDPRGPAPVLSHYQTRPLLDARQKGRATAQASCDLGLSVAEVAISDSGVRFPTGYSASWQQLQVVSEDLEHCFTFEDAQLTAIRRYSSDSQRTYSLLPTTDAPALIISGFTMHRFKNITPLEAARAMVATLGPLRGRVLDTTTGLGYTAGLAAKSAQEVITIERDPLCKELASLNPWSRSLTRAPKLEQRLGDSCAELEKFAPASFQAVIHDPPSMSLAGELYSGAFYELVFRALTARGRMFHYVGDPSSGFGAGVTRGVVRRLYAAGFRKVVAAPLAFGLVASK